MWTQEGFISPLSEQNLATERGENLDLYEAGNGCSEVLGLLPFAPISSPEREKN
jgi:hypothetical protein